MRGRAYLVAHLAALALLAIAGPLARRAHAAGAPGPGAGGTPTIADLDRVRAALPITVPAGPAFDAAARAATVAPRGLPSDVDRGWRFGASLYGWLAGVDGDVWSGGQRQDLSVAFEDLKDRTQFGLQTVLAARRGPWLAQVDVTVAFLRDQVDVPLGPLAIGVDVEVDQLLVDARLGYRVWRSCGPCVGDPCFPRRPHELYATIGARVFRNEVRTRVTGPMGGTLVDVHEVDAWVDGQVGLLLTGDLGRRWAYRVGGDVGGFGIGSSSELSWEAILLAGYRLSGRWTLFGGWRAQGQDRVEGSGSGRNGTDLVVHGPLVGISFSF